VSSVFFLFLFHQAVGLLVALGFVTDRAGERFFRTTSGIACLMTTLALGLLVRRYGLDGTPAAALGTRYGLLLALAGLSLALAVVYNRAWALELGGRRPLLLGAAGAGLASVVAGVPERAASLSLASDLSSVVLLGATTGAMILGHYYLVELELPIRALRSLTLLLAVALALRALVVGVALLGPLAAGLEEALRVARGLWSPDGVFVWMRLLFGIAGPAALMGLVWKTVEIRSTQSATGILYVQLFLVLSGELLAKYLRVAAGLPL
jgi:hypothetical protein